MNGGGSGSFRVGVMGDKGGEAWELAHPVWHRISAFILTTDQMKTRHRLCFPLWCFVMKRFSEAELRVCLLLLPLSPLQRISLAPVYQWLGFIQIYVITVVTAAAFVLFKVKYFWLFYIKVMRLAFGNHLYLSKSNLILEECFWIKGAGDQQSEILLKRQTKIDSTCWNCDILSLPSPQLLIITDSKYLYIKWSWSYTMLPKKRRHQSITVLGLAAKYARKMTGKMKKTSRKKSFVSDFFVENP